MIVASNISGDLGAFLQFSHQFDLSIVILGLLDAVALFLSIMVSRLVRELE